MNELFRLFANNLLPVFLVSGLGYLLAAKTGVDSRPLSRVGFMVFSPCLALRLIVANEISGARFFRMATFVVVTLGVLALLAWLIARRFGFSRTLASAVALVVLVPNAGNFGLSANLFAFGEAGLAEASIYTVTAASLAYTVGVFLASAGRAGVKAGVRNLLRAPTAWVVPAGFILVELGIRLPLPVERSIWLLADATIPTFLVILGLQLHGAKRSGPLPALALATTLRLVGGLVLGLIFARVFGLTGAARQAAVFQSAMPTAVICSILATEYDLEPALVTRVVFVSTLLSPLTLTPLLAYLGR